MQRAYRLGRQTQGLHPWLDYAAAGGTGGPFDARAFQAHGIAIEGCGISAPPPGIDPRSRTRHPKLECDINGLVPDGVATVTVRLTGAAHHTNLFRHPSDYYRLRPYTQTIRVLQNAWAFAKLPADPSSAGQQTVIWRDRSGRILSRQSF